MRELCSSGGAHPLEFLSATYRDGGLGQYFTPREVVNFMVDLANPKIGDKTIDPSCGSGGFLISVYDVVRDKPAC